MKKAQIIIDTLRWFEYLYDHLKLQWFLISAAWISENYDLRFDEIFL